MSDDFDIRVIRILIKLKDTSSCGSDIDTAEAPVQIICTFLFVQMSDNQDSAVIKPCPTAESVADEISELPRYA